MSLSISLKVTYENGSQEDLEFEKSSTAIEIESPDIVKIDLSPLEFATSLRTLGIKAFRLSSIDLSPLRFCSELEELSLLIIKLENIDLAPLSTCALLRKVEISSAVRPPGIFHSHLHEIDLSPLSSISNLEELTVSLNRVRFLDLAPISACTKLWSLDLYRNHLQELDLTPLSSCTSLRELNLGGNPFENIDLSGLDDCTNLETLLLTRTKLRRVDLSPLSSCESLRELYLRENRLRSINLSPLCSCKKLEQIELKRNQLRSLNLKPLRECTNLESLDLEGNNLKKLDLSPLASCHAFQTLDVRENPIQVLDVTPLVPNPNFDILLREDIPVTTWFGTPFPARTFSIYPHRVYQPPAPAESWEFLHRIVNIPHAMSIPVQSYILNALELDAYGLIDEDISEFLVSIPPETPLDDARESIQSFAIERICHQIDKGGTTIGIDVEVLAPEVGEIALRMDRIIELRISEMKKVKIWKAGEKHVNYDISQLAFTAHGFLLIKNLEGRKSWGFNKGQPGMVVEEEDLARILNAMKELGYEDVVEIVESFAESAPTHYEPQNMSRQMMYFVLGFVGTSSPLVP
jgi:Leucine-rich repeat (LRR) protein